MDDNNFEENNPWSNLSTVTTFDKGNIQNFRFHIRVLILKVYIFVMLTAYSLSNKNQEFVCKMIYFRLVLENVQFANIELLLQEVVLLQTDVLEKTKKKNGAAK